MKASWIVKIVELVALLGMLHCGSTKESTPIEDCGLPDGSILRETTLAKTNDPANPRPGANETLEIPAVVVTAIDTYDETQNGRSIGNVYVQDIGPPVPYAGITAFAPSLSPSGSKLFAGNVTALRGSYAEYPGPSGSAFDAGETLPLISASLSLLREDEMPPAFKAQPTDLYNYETGRKLLGMWVEMECSFEGPLQEQSSGRWAARIYVGDNGTTIGKRPTLSNSLFPVNTLDTSKFSKTSKYRIRGIVQYFYTFSIAPKGIDDVLLLCENCANQ